MDTVATKKKHLPKTPGHLDKKVPSGRFMREGPFSADPKTRSVEMLHREAPRRPKGAFIVVEANIGAGKTEFCNLLGNFRHARRGKTVEVMFEPSDDAAFLDMLNRFQKDGKRWAFSFQLLALKERFRQHTLAAELAINGIEVIQDRSIYADGCFAATAFNRGNMDEMEWEIYAETFGNMKRFLRYPDLMIFLNVPPETCVDRAKGRKREEEQDTVTLDYFQALHDQHVVLIDVMSSFMPTLIIDWENFGGGRINKVSDKIDELLAKPGSSFVRDWLRL
jgi:deoxyadenosine/deoxycytidine kinase